MPKTTSPSSDTIHYIDVHGKRRWASWLEPVPWLVVWREGQEPEAASRYKLDDGSIVQIPNSAWRLVTRLNEEQGVAHDNEHAKSPTPC